MSGKPRSIRKRQRRVAWALKRRRTESQAKVLLAVSAPPVRGRLYFSKNLGDLLSHRLSLGKQIKIIRATGLGICARHIESPKRMRAYDRSRAFAIDVEITHVELANGTFDLVARLAVDRSGQAKLGIIRDLQCVIIISGFDNRKHRAENLFL